MMQMTIRKSISFPRELVEKIQEKANLNERSFSAQVVYDLRYWYESLEAKKESNEE